MWCFVRFTRLIAIVFAIQVMAGAMARPTLAAEGGEFISADTVIIGCTAGAGASGFAAVVPLMTTAFGGSVLVTPAIVAAWTGIGCAVGIISGVIAIGTAWTMETMNQAMGNPPTAMD